MGGNIAIDITTKQKDALKLLMDNNSPVTEVLYGGGARGGKTWLGCLWQIVRRINYPGSASMICRRDFVDLKSTTMVTFRKVARAMGVDGLIKYKEGAGDNLAEFSNGSVIFFRYCKFQPTDPMFDKFGSYELTDIFVDEAQQVEETFINVIRGRFSLLSGTFPDGKEWKAAPKMLITCNPSKGWIYRNFWQPYKDGTLPEYRRFIRALATDNLYIDEKYFENLLRSDKVTIQRLYYGNFDYDDDPNALFNDYDALCDMFTNEVEQGRELAAGASDIALKGRDLFAVCTAKHNVFTFGKILAFSPADKVQEIAEEEIRKNKIPRSRFCADADGLGAFLSDYVKGIKEFHGGATALDSATYSNLKSECYMKLAKAVNERKIRVDGLTPDMQQRLIEELQAIRITDIDTDTAKKSINSKKEQKKILGRSPDIADTLMMCFYAYKLLKGSRGIKASVGRLN